jgi:predicted small secreted protein
VTSITASRCTTRYDHFSSMTPYSKLVAAGLAIALLLLPAAALASCSQHMSGMGKHDPHSAMMGMVSPPVSFAAAPTNRCCEMSAAESVATFPVRASTNDVAGVTPTDAVSILQAQWIPTNNKCMEPRAPDSPPQALLCVFLI